MNEKIKLNHFSPSSEADRPVPRVVSIHTKNFVEGESIRDSRNRRVFDSLVRNGTLKSKADMIVVSVNCKNTADSSAPAEAVFVSCSCEERDDVIFHLTRDELSEEWITFDGDFKFNKAVKVTCGCESPSGKFRFEIKIEEMVYKNRIPLSTFFINAKHHKYKLKIFPNCACDEFVLRSRKVNMGKTSALPVFPFFTHDDEEESVKPKVNPPFASGGDEMVSLMEVVNEQVSEDSCCSEDGGVPLFDFMD